MTMEHRWSARKPIAMDVEVFYPPIGSVPGRTRDVSMEGMFVHTGGVFLPTHAKVEVSFHTAGSAGNCEHRLPAYVVHGNGDGVGLMLRHVGYDDFDALRYMLRTAA
ncbi:MAG: PilZ domain-containing protein [Gammaproteobacteria bacterium]